MGVLRSGKYFAAGLLTQRIRACGDAVSNSKLRSCREHSRNTEVDNISSFLLFRSSLAIMSRDFLHASCPILTSGSENSNLGMITFAGQMCNFWSMFGENTLILSIKSSDGFHWFSAQTPNNDEIGTAGSVMFLKDSKSDLQKPPRNFWWRSIEASCVVLFT